MIIILSMCHYCCYNVTFFYPEQSQVTTQITVLPVPTRHRRHACIKMRTALPANTKTRPNVVSMLFQRRWRWANIETALGQMLAFAGSSTQVSVYTLSRQPIRVLLARQPADHKLTTILEIESGGHMTSTICTF